MEQKFLFMVLVGCTPKGRLTEQHDVYFGIANTIKELIPEIKAWWPEANGIMHIDAWQKITNVTNFSVEVNSKTSPSKTNNKLFFINLGGYKPNEFEEYHYKTLCVANSKAEAIAFAKQTTFYKHTGFKGAASHIDDKYGVDVDDVFEINDVLSPEIKKHYQLNITPSAATKKDELHIGYLNLAKLLKT
jgi:hypothetical protein